MSAPNISRGIEIKSNETVNSNSPAGVLKKPLSGFALPIDSNHMVKVGVQVDYFLDKDRTPVSPEFKNKATTDSSKKKNSKARKSTTHLNSVDAEKHQYYMTWQLSDQTTGRTGILYNDNSCFNHTHDIEVNESVLVEFYTNPVEFLLWESMVGHEWNGRTKAGSAEGQQSAAKALPSSEFDKKTTPKAKTDSANPKNSKKKTAATTKTDTETPENTLDKTHDIKAPRPESSKKVTFEAGQQSTGVSTAKPQNQSAVEINSDSDEQEGEGETSPPKSKNVSAKSLPRLQPHPHHFQHPHRTMESSMGLKEFSIGDDNDSSADGTIEKGLRQAQHPADYAPLERHSRGSSAQSQLGSSKSLRIKSTTGSANVNRKPVSNSRAVSAKSQKSNATSTSDVSNSSNTLQKASSQFISLKELKEQNTVLIRPKTPPQPHHHKNYLQTVDPVPANKKTVNKLERSRLGRGEQRQVLVGKITVDPSALFFGELIIEKELDAEIEGISFCSITLSLNEPLLNKIQRKLLNPMSIFIDSLFGLPSTPTPFAILDAKCSPVTTQIKYFGLRRTLVAKPLNKHRNSVLNFRARHLVLAGVIDQDQLKQKLLQEPMAVEVHDRELLEETSSISVTELATSCPYGIANFSLSPLALGANKLTLTSSIFPVPKNSSEHWAIAPALWLEGMASLKIQVKLERALCELNQVAPNEAMLETAAPGRKLCRVVITGTTLYKSREIQEYIARVSFNTFFKTSEDADLPIAHVLRTISELSLDPAQRANAFLDYISGFCIVDGPMFVFMVEGLSDGAIQGLLNLVRQDCDKHDFRAIDFPNQVYTERIWTGLYSSLTFAKMKKPVADIMRSKDIYIRQKTDEDLYTALTSLLHFETLSQFSGSIFKSCQPSNSMMQRLIQAYGQKVSTASEILALFGLFDSDTQSVSIATTENGASSESCDVVDVDWDERVAKFYESMKQSDFGDRFKTETYNYKFIDYINERNANAHATIGNQTPRKVNIYKRERTLGDSPVYNYSIQTNNSQVAQKEEFRKLAAKEPNNLYVIGDGSYLAEVVTSVNYDKVQKDEQRAIYDSGTNKPRFQAIV